MSCWRPSNAARRRWREVMIKMRRSNMRRRPAINRLLYIPKDLIPTKLNFRLSLLRKTNPNLLFWLPRRNPKAIRRILIMLSLCSSSSSEGEATLFPHHPLPLPREALQLSPIYPLLLRPLPSTSTLPASQNRICPRPRLHPLSTLHLPANQHYHLLLPPSQAQIFPHHPFLL